MFSKIFFLSVAICMGIIIYAAYTYIQDKDNIKINRETPATDGSKTPEEKPKEATDNTGDKDDKNDTTEDSSAPAVTNNIDQLSDSIADEVKKELTQSEQSDNNALNYFNVSFVDYDEEQKQLNLGLTSDIMSKKKCSIEIENEQNQLLSETVPAMANQAITGCRFKNLDLSNLDEPSDNNKWQITLTAKDDNNDSLAYIKKDITSNQQLIQLTQETN